MQKTVDGLKKLNENLLKENQQQKKEIEILKTSKYKLDEIHSKLNSNNKILNTSSYSPTRKISQINGSLSFLPSQKKNSIYNSNILEKSNDLDEKRNSSSINISDKKENLTNNILFSSSTNNLRKSLLLKDEQNLQKSLPQNLITNKINLKSEIETEKKITKVVSNEINKYPIKYQVLNHM